MATPTILTQDNDVRATLEPIPRDTHLTQLLHRLQKADDLFDYNVPAQVRRTFDDEKLWEYLHATYQQKAFIIDNPADVEKYLRVHDWVVLKEEYQTYNWRIEKNKECEVIKDGNEPIVRFLESNRECQLSLEDIRKNHYKKIGRRVSMFERVTDGEVTDLFQGPFSRYHESYGITEAEYMALSGQLLVYTGPGFGEINVHIPKGATGIVMQKETMLHSAGNYEDNEHHDCNVRAAWAAHPDLKGNDHNLEYSWIALQNVQMLRQNHISWEKMIQGIHPNEDGVGHE